MLGRPDRLRRLSPHRPGAGGTGTANRGPSRRCSRAPVAARACQSAYRRRGPCPAGHGGPGLMTLSRPRPAVLPRSVGVVVVALLGVASVASLVLLLDETMN